MLRVTLKKTNKLLFSFFVIYYMCFGNVTFGATKATGISAFPASYQIYLKQLKKLRPNWSFTALNTGLNWNQVVANEGPNVSIDRSVVPLSFSDAWKWKNSKGKYNTVETGWVTASEPAIGYAMDPRRYLNEMQIFQFETLKYDSNTQNQEGVEKIFYGTLMYKKDISYTDTNGKKQAINKTYSKVVMEAASKYGVSPYHLASRIKQETGCDLNNNTSIKGTVSGYVGLYNYFNIGATGGNNPAISGLAYARSVGWTNPELAINGGAEFVAKKYINVGQYTTYLQKFNVNNDSSYSLYTHQYMQNILAPANEAISTYNAYLKMSLLDIPFNFVIPVYTNMPNSPVDIYVQNSSDYVVDSTKVYTTSNLNIRSGPGTDNSAILTVPKGTVLTRIARGVQSGERWDKVRLSTGVEGYAFQNYIKEYTYTKVANITLNKSQIDLKIGDKYSLLANIFPTNANYKDVYWSSSNNDIVSVTDTGELMALKEGIAIITVTTEDQLKTASCVVNITKKKEPSISLDKDVYNIIKGKDILPNVVISDSDVADYDITIDNEQIAKYENGKVLGLSAGETNVTVKIKETEIQDTAVIKVIDLGNNDILIDKSINVNGNIITRINPGTKMSELKDKIQTTNQIAIENINGEKLLDDSLIGTGSKVRILSMDNTILYEYTVIIYGDVNGDSKITSKDYMMIKNHIMGTSIIKGSGAEAADSYNDARITSKDYMVIKNHIMEISSISQDRGGI